MSGESQVEAQGMPPIDKDSPIWEAILFWECFGDDRSVEFAAVNATIQTYAQSYGDARAAAERERWEKALQQAWLNEIAEGQHGAYQVGHHDGYLAALQAIRAATPEGDAP